MTFKFDKDNSFASLQTIWEQLGNADDEDIEVDKAIDKVIEEISDYAATLPIAERNQFYSTISTFLMEHKEKTTREEV